jgi:uncharacterized membrane protein YhfC
MLIPLIVVEILFMCAVPVVLAIWLHRRWSQPWMLIVAGGVTFIGSQVVHLPLNAGITALFRFEVLPPIPDAWKLPFNAIVGGLTAGICEEAARYLVMRFWAKECRTWRQAVVLGAGHGGIESILTGLLVGVTLANMVVVRSAGPESLGLEGEQAAVLAQAVAAFWETPWYMPLLAAFERLVAMTLHLALSVMVMRVFVTGKLWLLGAAILWHMSVNAAAVYALGTRGPLAAEGILILLSGVSAAVLWVVYQREQAGEA